MGAKEAKLKEQFLFAIVANKEGEVANFLQKYPEYVNTKLVQDTTNPICRASYLGFKNLVSLLLKYGADINQRSSDGRTPVMWAAFRNNENMVEYLLDNGADITAEDEKGWNAIDLCVIKMNYEAAQVLKRRGLQPKDKATYMEHLWQKYDVDMFLQYLEEDRTEVEHQRFFDLIKFDTRETWKHFFKRQLNFEDPPLIPREELPDNKQPHRSFYGKLACFVNNIDPYPQRQRNQEGGNALDQTNSSFSARAPLQDFIPPNIGQARQTPGHTPNTRQEEEEVFQQVNQEKKSQTIMRDDEGYHHETEDRYAINGSQHEPERRSIVQEERKSQAITMRQVDHSEQHDQVAEKIDAEDDV